MNPTISFTRRALADQARIGAVLPTSTALARRMAQLVAPAPGLRVLELGAGTGVITAAVGPRLGPGAVHLALERDPAMLDALARAAPRAVPVHGDATDLAEHVAAAGLDGVDVVLSSLPWSNFPSAVAERVLAGVRRVLAPAGTFVTIAYRPTRLNPGSRRFRGLLDASFAQVVPSSTTWANVPPARLLVAHGPRPEAPDA